MMKGIVLALLALAVTAMPGFAADTSAPASHAPGMSEHMMPPSPEMKQHMMHNPLHLLAMAYHKNLVTFGLALKKVAQKGETVPRDFARAAITEMRRSADQMEIYHEQALREMPAEMKAKQGEMVKKMGAHLAEMRTELAQLVEISKGDRIDSKQVLKHLQLLFRICHGMGHEAGMSQGMPGDGCGKWMHRRGMDCGCESDMDCDCGSGMDCDRESGRDCGCWDGRDCGDRHGRYNGNGWKEMDCGQGPWMRRGQGNPDWREMMQGRQKMMAEMKAQDAEISRLVDQMNAAPNDRKQAIMADILTRMVKQRAEMVAHMEAMQEHMKHRHPWRGAMEPCMQSRGDDEDDSEDADVDNDDSDDSDSDDGYSGSGTMDMRNMNMNH